MLKLTSKNFKDLKDWKLASNPFKAIKDFSELKSEQRWENLEHSKEYKKNFTRRKNISPKKNVFSYYKRANLNISYNTWNYLRKRKPYYIMPLGWDNIAKNGGKVLDIGCGDGDVIQNLIDYVEKYWKKNKITSKKLEITGIDLNKTRIENAKKHVKTNSKNIKKIFYADDLSKMNILSLKEKKFDYCLCTAVFEMLDDKQFNSILNRLTKIISKGIYIQELIEKFPGGFPRENFNIHLVKRGFIIKKKYKIFSEPFNKKKLFKPSISAILIHQNIYAEKNGR